MDTTAHAEISAFLDRYADALAAGDLPGIAACYAVPALVVGEQAQCVGVVGLREHVQHRHAGGWHVDGGVRLNAPLKPALALGADALVVVGTHPVERASGLPQAPDQRPPDVDDALVQLVDAALNELVPVGARRPCASA